MKLLTFCVGLIMPFALAGQDSSVNIKILTTPFDLVITEILADPDPSFGLPVAEYVELLNRSSVPVNLSGWVLFEGSSRALPALTILPGEYLIVCANSDTAKFTSCGKVAGVSSMSLTNTGEKIAIRNPAGIALDSVIYSDSWYGSSYKKDGGWSLERIDVNFTCVLADNWKPSIHAHGGTPGIVNSVDGIYTDNIAPVLLNAYCPDSVSVILNYSEALDPGALSSTQNFQISNAPAPVSISFADASFTKILIHLASNVTRNQIATIKAKSIFDCAGNYADSTRYARFGLPDTGIPSGVVINEVLFNPKTDGYDFVELYHNGFSIYDVSSFRLASFNLTTGEITGVNNISEQPQLIFPGDYLVITEKPEVVATHYHSSYPYNFITSPDIPSMNIDEGHIGIMFDGTVIDNFHYNESMHFELIDEVKGISLEKINPSRASSDMSAWHSASPQSGGATPGLINSQYTLTKSGKKSVTVYPEIFSPDNDGYGDVITFSLDLAEQGFISNITIYNSNGQMVYEFPKNLLAAPHEQLSWAGISNQNTKVAAGIYVGLVEIFNLKGEQHHFRLPFVVAQKL